MTPPKLTVELVPKTAWFKNVRSEVSKERWDNIRKLVYMKALYSCEICGGQGPKWPVECHEVWEYDDTKHIQRLVRMTGICPDCHQVKHIGLAERMGHLKDALAHLAKVNKWDEKQARQYVKEQFEVWQQRSRYKWTLDLSALDRYAPEKKLSSTA